MEYELIKPVIKTPLSPIEQVLTNRGIGLAEVKQYLHTTDDDILDYHLIDNMEQGAIMLASHIKNEDDILIQVDPDADGYCSSAILINYLNSIFPGFVQNHIIYQLHDDKAHGIIVKSIPNTVKMVIAPDSSSNEEDIHKQLKEQGIDVLVIDHHEAESVSQYACIINNQLCDYPNKSLCGAAMVYKFCCFLDELLDCDNANDFLDLTALALVADMMDLRNLETRHLVTKGLDNLRNPFFKAMAKRQQFSIDKGGGLNPFTIGWYIAPLINAVVRSGTINEKTLLFESMIDFKAYEQIPSNKRGVKKGSLEPRVDQAVRTCTNVKNRQERTKQTNTEVIEKIIEKFNLLENHKILLIRLDQEHRIDSNLTGLIANQLASKYQRPTLILNYHNNDGVESWDGSGRNYAFSKIENLKDFLNDTGLMKLAQGHQSAFGAGIYDKDVEKFVETTDKELADIDFGKKYLVDFIFQASDIDVNAMLELGSYSNFWGQNIEEPYIAIENIVFKENDIQLIGDKQKTIKFNLPNGVNAITFSGSEELFNELQTLAKTNRFTFVGKCKINNWGGQFSPQLLLEDYSTSFYF